MVRGSRSRGETDWSAFCIGRLIDLTFVIRNTCHTENTDTVADPGFPRGGANPKSRESTYYPAKFTWKLHENEENYTEGGGRASKLFLCKSAAANLSQYKVTWDTILTWIIISKSCIAFSQALQSYLLLDKYHCYFSYIYLIFNKNWRIVCNLFGGCCMSQLEAEFLSWVWIQTTGDFLIAASFPP